MNGKILELILEYFSKRKEIDFEYLGRLADIYLAQYDMNIKDYLDGFCISDYIESLEKGGTFGAYNFDHKGSKKNFVVISKELYQEIMEKELKYITKYQPKYKTELYNYLYFTKLFLHEFEHVVQRYKDTEQIGNKDELLLLRACFDSKNQPKEKNKEYYENIYFNKTSERLAELKSVATMKRVLEPIKKDVPLFLDYINGYGKLFALGKSYTTKKIDDCPAHEFLKIILCEKVWKQMSFYSFNKDKLFENVCDKYMLEDRLLYGFPIAIEELCDEYDKLDQTFYYQALRKQNK